MAPLAHLMRGKAGLQVRPMCPIAAMSFTVGLMALRLSWLPGVDVLLAAASLVMGTAGMIIVLRRDGRVFGFEEALSGIILGLIVLALGVFFTSAFVRAFE